LEENFPKSLNTKLLVKNYLSGTYPEELIKDIFLLKKEKLIAIIPTKKYYEIPQELLEKAEQISTIAIELYCINTTTTISHEEYAIKIDNGIYYLPGTPSKTFNLKDFEINSLSYSLLKYDSKNSLKQFLLPSIFILIALALFITGNIFKVKKLDSEISILNNKIDEIYKKAT